MRYTRKGGAAAAEGDMTPMIDMTFQLIAFFMVLVNFTDVDQHELITLPASIVAQVPNESIDLPLTIQVKGDGGIIFGGQDMDLEGLRRKLVVERHQIDRQMASSSKPKEPTIIIRGNHTAKAGVVQEVMQLCKKLKFENFKLAAMQRERT